MAQWLAQGYKGTVHNGSGPLWQWFTMAQGTRPDLNLACTD